MKTPTREVGNLLPRNKNLISNYSQESEIESSSSESHENETDSDPKTQEGEEENLTLSEHISVDSDDNQPTETRPAISRNGVSSSIEDVTQVTGKQRIPSVIPHRPTGKQPDVQSAPAKQARCDALAAQLKALRGYALENEATVREQAEAIRQLVTRYSDDELAWVLVYTFRFSEQYQGVKPGPKYASVLLEVAPTALQEPALRQLAMHYSDADIAWIQYYASHFSSEYKTMNLGLENAVLLLKVAPEAMQAAASSEVRAMLMQQSVAPAASIPPAAPSRQLQQPQPDNPYSVAAQLARQNNGR